MFEFNNESKTHKMKKELYEYVTKQNVLMMLLIFWIGYYLTFYKNVTYDQVSLTDKHNISSMTNKMKKQQLSVEFDTYCDLLKRTLTGYVYPEAGGVRPGRNIKRIAFNAAKRWGGRDWPYVGHTMIGMKRLSSLQEILLNITQKNNNIAGDFLEAGVWRGGTCIFARIVLNILGEYMRKVWVFDSFEGLPPNTYQKDINSHMKWDSTPYLEVSLETVKSNFKSYGLDVNDIRHIQFVKGFFNESMSLVYNKIINVESLAILRMDGDMYESSIDILFNVWHLVSIDGVIIVDDWFGFPAQLAVKDFFSWHNVSLPFIHKVDELSVYFTKEATWKNIKIKREIYKRLINSKYNNNKQ
eukprot:230419_1